MKILKNLAYRIERFFTGKEEGIVEKVESAPFFDESGKEIKYPKDYFGNIPSLVTFRNPLGQLVTKPTPKILVPVNSDFMHPSTSVDAYKKYKPGDKYP